MPRQAPLALLLAAALAAATLAPQPAHAQQVAALTVANATGQPGDLSLTLQGQPLARGGHFPPGTNTALTLVRPGTGQELVATVDTHSAAAQITLADASTTLVVVHGRHPQDAAQLADLLADHLADQPATPECPGEQPDSRPAEEAREGCDDRREEDDGRTPQAAVPEDLAAALAALPRTPLEIATFDLTPLLPSPAPQPDSPHTLHVLSFLGPEHGEFTVNGEAFTPRAGTVSPADPDWDGREVTVVGDGWRTGIPGSDEAPEPGTALLLLLHPDPSGAPSAQSVPLRPIPGTSH